MKFYLITLTLVFSAGLGWTWNWAMDHRMSYLSRDYAFLVGKEGLIDDYSKPGLVVFGDSAVMDGVSPVQLGPIVINCGMSGCTPIESYFLLRRLMKASVRPKAVILSYNAYHFVHPDFYWENGVKFGLISGMDADHVLENIFRLKDKTLISGKGLWNLEECLYSFLLSRGFPAYYISSFIADRYGIRLKENEEALAVITRTRGQYYFPLANGSKDLNADTKLKAFAVSPVIDYYFRKTLQLLKNENIPTYFYAMPINESSIPYIKPNVFKAYKNYLTELTHQYPQFHILSKLQTVYSWKLFSDYAHLNEKGAAQFNRAFAEILNQKLIPGGPYGMRHGSSYSRNGQ